MPTSESLPVLSGRSTFPWTAICLILSIFSPSLTTARNCGLDISPIALALNSTWDSIGDEARRKKLHWGLLTQVPGNSNSFMSLWPSLELNNIYVADPKWNLDRIINQEFANWITGGEVIMSSNYDKSKTETFNAFLERDDINPRTEMTYQLGTASLDVFSSFSGAPPVNILNVPLGIFEKVSEFAPGYLGLGQNSTFLKTLLEQKLIQKRAFSLYPRGPEGLSYSAGENIPGEIPGELVIGGYDPNKFTDDTQTFKIRQRAQALRPGSIATFEMNYKSIDWICENNSTSLYVLNEPYTGDQRGKLTGRLETGYELQLPTSIIQQLANADSRIFMETNSDDPQGYIRIKDINAVIKAKCRLEIAFLAANDSTATGIQLSLGIEDLVNRDELYDLPGENVLTRLYYDTSFDTKYDVSYATGLGVLQQLYLTVDYDRGEFKVSTGNANPSKPPQEMKDYTSFCSEQEKLEDGQSANSNNSDTTLVSNSGESEGGLPKGAIAGVVVGAVIGLGALALTVVLVTRARKPKEGLPQEMASPEPRVELATPASPQLLYSPYPPTFPAELYNQQPEIWAQTQTGMTDHAGMQGQPKVYLGDQDVYPVDEVYRGSAPIP